MFYLKALKELKDEQQRQAVSELSNTETARILHKHMAALKLENEKQELREHLRRQKELVKQFDATRLKEIERYKQNKIGFNYWFHWVHLDRCIKTPEICNHFIQQYSKQPIGFYTLNNYLAREFYLYCQRYGYSLPDNISISQLFYIPVYEYYLYFDGNDIVLIHPSFNNYFYVIVNPALEFRDTLVMREWDVSIDRPDFNFRFVFWDKAEDSVLYTSQVDFMLMVNPIDDFHMRKIMAPETASYYSTYYPGGVRFYFSIEKCYFIVSSPEGLFAVIPDHPNHMIYIEHLRPNIFVHPHGNPNDLYTIEQADS